MSPYVARILPSIAAFEPADWRRLYGPASEGFDYYRACEEAQPDSFKFIAAGVLDGERLIAGVPLFRADFRLDMPLQGRLKRLGNWLHRYAPRLVSLRVLGAGSPHSDHLALALDDALGSAARAAALEALLGGLLTHARDKQSRADIIAVKDVTDAQARWADPVFRRLGFARIATLPVAVLELPFKSEAQYIESLSQNQRSNLRRKLKKAKDVRVEVRDNVDGLDRQIAELREATRLDAEVDYGDFEQVAPGYFAAVMRHMPDRARALLYWQGEVLVGFALVFLEPERMIFQYVGMRYPAAKELGIYFLNWMTMIRLCLERGIPKLHAGQTTYLTKCRLGCELERTWIYFRARGRAWNVAVKTLGPLFAIDRMDPDLKALGDKARYVGRDHGVPATPGAA